MNRLAQESRRRQGVVKYAEKYGKSKAARQYDVSLSSVKRWIKRYDGTWQPLWERSHRPNSHPKQHTPENSVDFLERLLRAFPLPIQTVQTDNGTEFTYRFISDKERHPFEKALAAKRISHKLIPPRTPWHNGKVERSHRCDQRCFYDWEKFAGVHELNRKLRTHLSWYNEKPMRSLDLCSPLQRLSFFTGLHH